MITMAKGKGKGGHGSGSRGSRPPRDQGNQGLGDLGSGAIKKMQEEGFEFGGIGGSRKITGPGRRKVF